MELHYRQLTNPRKETPCRIEPPFSLLQLRLPRPFPEFRKPHPSRRFLQRSRPMPLVSLRFIIIGIITDTTGITIIIVITIIITTSDLALPTRGAYAANSLVSCNLVNLSSWRKRCKGLARSHGKARFDSRTEDVRAASRAMPNNRIELWYAGNNKQVRGAESS